MKLEAMKLLGVAQPVAADGVASTNPELQKFLAVVKAFQDLTPESEVLSSLWTFGTAWISPHDVPMLMVIWDWEVNNTITITDRNMINNPYCKDSLKDIAHLCTMYLLYKLCALSLAFRCSGFQLATCWLRRLL